MPLTYFTVEYGLTTGNVTVTGANGSIVTTGNISGNQGNLSGLAVTANATFGNINSVSGILSVTGNANVGNIGGTRGVFTNLVGTLETASQTNITSVGTLTSLNVTGNANVGNIGATRGVFTNIVGTLETASQTNITSVGTLGNLSVSGNANVGNIGATRGVFTNVVGTLETASQPNITSVGTLSSVSVSGNANVGNLGTTGLITATGNITGGNLKTGNLVLGSDTLSSSFHTITIDPSSVGAGGNVVIQGNLTVTGVTTTVNSTTVDIADLNITLAKGAADASAANGAGLTIDGAGATLTYNSTSNSWVFDRALSVNGNANVGNIGATRGVFSNLAVSGTSNLGPVANVIITGGSSGQFLQTDGTGNLSFATISTTTLANGTSNVAIPVANGNVNTSVNGVANVFVVTSTGVNVAGTINGTGNANVGNIGAAKAIFTSTASVSDTTTVNTGNVATAIANGGSAGIGNIGAPGQGFDTLYARQASANYADLAEIYASDAVYEYGTVMVFGGTAEVTISTLSHQTSIAGVVSHHPAFLMNDTASGLPIALMGRVPCRVKGPVKKGDVLVASSTAGVAEKLKPAKFKPGCVIGKALAEITDKSVELIEVVVGRL